MCVANKRAADAVYYSRVGSRAARDFLVREGWPDALLRFFDAHAHDLGHLLWDVGIDFARTTGDLRVDKSGIYGSF
jgi:hypothetical protein